MKETNVVCGVKICKNYSDRGCKKKVVVLDLAGKCLSLEELTASELAAAEAAQAAAEGVLQYGA